MQPSLRPILVVDMEEGGIIVEDTTEVAIVEGATIVEGVDRGVVATVTKVDGVVQVFQTVLDGLSLDFLQQQEYQQEQLGQHSLQFSTCSLLLK